MAENAETSRPGEPRAVADLEQLRREIGDRLTALSMQVTYDQWQPTLDGTVDEHARSIIADIDTAAPELEQLDAGYAPRARLVVRMLVAGSGPRRPRERAEDPRTFASAMTVAMAEAVVRVYRGPEGRDVAGWLDERAEELAVLGQVPAALIADPAGGLAVAAAEAAAVVAAARAGAEAALPALRPESALAAAAALYCIDRGILAGRIDRDDRVYGSGRGRGAPIGYFEGEHIYVAVAAKAPVLTWAGILAGLDRAGAVAAEAGAGRRGAGLDQVLQQGNALGLDDARATRLAGAVALLRIDPSARRDLVKAVDDPALYAHRVTRNIEGLRIRLLDYDHVLKDRAGALPSPWAQAAHAITQALPMAMGAEQTEAAAAQAQDLIDRVKAGYELLDFEVAVRNAWVKWVEGLIGTVAADGPPPSLLAVGVGVDGISAASAAAPAAVACTASVTGFGPDPVASPAEVAEIAVEGP